MNDIFPFCESFQTLAMYMILNLFQCLASDGPRYSRMGTKAIVAKCPTLTHVLDLELSQMQPCSRFIRKEARHHAAILGQRKESKGATREHSIRMSVWIGRQ